MNKEKLKKIYLSVFLVYVICIVAFAFLAGDQLKYRKTANKINMDEATTISNEIVYGVSVEQTFVNNIDRLESFSFVCTTFYRDNNNGILSVELLVGNKVLYNKAIFVRDIEEQRTLTFNVPEPIENLRGKELTIKISSTSSEGHGIAIMANKVVNANETFKNGKFYTNGKICFEVDGTDYIFSGKYYWHVMTIVGVLLALSLVYSYSNFINNKLDYIVEGLKAIQKYRFLISQLVSRDFKTKYKRSVFGVLWSFLNPLLTMMVQFLVFSTFFKSDISNYPVYLLSGVVCFSFFNEVCAMCLTSISSNAHLITKVYIPKYIFPLSRTISSSINLFISLVPLILVTLLTGLALHNSFILMFFFLICLIVFALGMGMILSTLMVFFRDIQFLWNVISMIWMYATPIFYPASIIPTKYSFIIRLNPIYHFIKNIRICLIDGISPDPRNYFICLACALISFLLGTYIFKKNQDKFTLYL